MSSGENQDVNYWFYLCLNGDQKEKHFLTCQIGITFTNVLTV